MGYSYFRLEVWKPARPDRPLVYSNGFEGAQGQSAIQEDYLHEQIYSWSPRGDVFLSLGSDDLSAEIRQLFTEGFSSNLPPKEREFPRLVSLLGLIEAHLRNSEGRQWQSWEQSLSDEDPNSLFRLQPLLSLYHHLKWVYDVFKDIPGASVTVR